MQNSCEPFATSAGCLGYKVLKEIHLWDVTCRGRSASVTFAWQRYRPLFCYLQHSFSCFSSILHFPLFSRYANQTLLCLFAQLVFSQCGDGSVMSYPTENCSPFYTVVDSPSTYLFLDTVGHYDIVNNRWRNQDTEKNEQTQNTFSTLKMLRYTLVCN